MWQQGRGRGMRRKGGKRREKRNALKKLENNRRDLWKESMPTMTKKLIQKLM